jgi:hypothetical protein
MGSDNGGDHDREEGKLCYVSEITQPVSVILCFKLTQAYKRPGEWYLYHSNVGLTLLYTWWYMYEDTMGHAVA